MEVKTDLRDGHGTGGEDEYQGGVGGNLLPVVPTHIPADRDDAHEKEECGRFILGSATEDEPA